MSKNHRGTGIRSLAAHGRATCPTLMNKARIAAKNAAPATESAAE